MLFPAEQGLKRTNSCMALTYYNPLSMLFPAEQGLKLHLAQPLQVRICLSMLFPAEQGLKLFRSFLIRSNLSSSQCYFQQNKD